MCTIEFWFIKELTILFRTLSLFEISRMMCYLIDKNESDLSDLPFNDFFTINDEPF